MDLALGLGDYYDIGALYSDELGSADFYYRLLNAGFHLPATGGTDNFSDVWLDPPPGSDRTFAHLTGPLTMANWMDAIKRGHTFFSTGPMLMLTVDGKEPGDEIALAARAADSCGQADVEVDRAGRYARDSRERGSRADRDERRIRCTVVRRPGAVPQGGWVAARAIGPKSKYIGDDYAFAQTSRRCRSCAAARYSRRGRAVPGETMDAIWTRVERSRWRSDAERDAFRAEVDSARAVYSRIADSAR